LILPISLKPWQVVVISFFVGMVLDIFSSTPGLHMAASGFIGYLRIFYLKFACSKEDFEGSIEPNISKKGLVWFLIYITSFTLVHHILLFYLEIYSIREFFQTFLRVITSSVFSILIMGISQLLFYKGSNLRK
jgi:hypothetical protein